MNDFISKIKPRDVIALFIVAGGIWLKFSGADGLVGTLLTAIVFYYFGKRIGNDH